jgi:hypothetical protein
MATDPEGSQAVAERSLVEATVGHRSESPC